MDTAELADFIARHALVLLLGLTGLLLLATAFLWALIERYMPRLYQRVVPFWRRVDSRGIAARYLGWHAAIAFVVLAVGSAAFIEVADEISPDEDLGVFDEQLSAALGRHLGDATLRAVGVLTYLGDPELLIPAAAAIALLLFWRREWLLGWAWIVGTSGGALLNRLLKELFERTRPAREHVFANADGFSFPSGHASGSMLVFGLGAYFIVRRTAPAWHVPTTLVAMLLIVFVGASRVLLQVHYFSDVLAGWMVAASWTALSIAGLEALRLGALRRGGTRSAQDAAAV